MNPIDKLKDPNPPVHDSGAGSWAPGTVLRQRYTLEQWLGRGGTGNVFKARDAYRADLHPSEHFVALKIPHADPARRADISKNLRREFFSAQKLSHRNIVKVYELDRDGDVEFFTMELLEGELLSGIIDRLYPASMPRPHAWWLIREIGMGLAHAHSRGIVHSDLKPHNILITHAGEVRILDFGASTYSDPQSERPRQSRGARSATVPAYASCELLEGRPPDAADDIYAFACIAYELLTGSHPFQRRPAIEARNLGIVPTRPHGLTGRQWQTLKTGLSWHRAGRSIPFHIWLDRLAVDRFDHPLPPPAHIKPAIPVPRYSAPLKAAALCAGAVFALTAVLFVSAASGKKTRDDQMVAAPASTTTVDAGAPDTGSTDGGSKDTAAAAPATAAADPVPLPVGKLPKDKTGPEPRSLGRRTPRSAASAAPPLLAASNYKIRAGDRFAEVRVRRSGSLPDNATFVWWTEAASAKPGIDYVQQGKVTQQFPKGKSATSFFVRLVPKVSRTEPQVFYIAVAAAARGAGTGEIARTAIWLPTSGDSS